MIARLVLLCLAEGALVVLLALQVFAGGPPEQRPPDAAPALGAPRPAPATAGQPAAPAAGAPARPAPAEREQVATKWRADDPVGVLLTGTVRRRDGAAVDASISLTRDKERRSTSSDDGAYALTGLQPGAWRATLRGTGIVPAEATVTLTDDAVQRHDFVVDASHPVKVMIVTPDGADATFAVRTTLHWRDFQVAGQAERFPDRLAPTDYGAVFVGDARWDDQMNPRDGFAGTLHFAALPAHVALLQRHLVLEQKLVNPGDEEVRFVVDLEALRKLSGTATVRVVDADGGAPIAGARVSLATSNAFGRGLETDAEGRAVVRDLSPGFLVCRVQAKEREPYVHTIRIDPGQQLDLGEIRLGTVHKLHGKVLDPEGKPTGAELSWTQLKWRTSPAGFVHNRITLAEADGSFVIPDLGAGKVAVRATGKDGLLAAAVVVNPPVEPVVLRLAAPGQCTVTRPADPRRSFTLTLLDADDNPIDAYFLAPRRTEQTLKMPAGDYRFEVHDDRGERVQAGTARFATPPGTLEIR